MADDEGGGIELAGPPGWGIGAAWIVMKRQLLYIQSGVYLGRCEGDCQF